TLKEERTPAVFEATDYTAAASGVAVTAPSLDPPTRDGLVKCYSYNSDKRLEWMGVRNALSTDPATKIVEITYGDSANSNEREHLPKLIERIADPSGGANGKESISFTYQISGGSDSNAVRSIQTDVEAELPSENGPATSGTAKKYSSISLLDAKGQPVGF